MSSPELVPISFYVINVKLQSTKEGEERQEAYLDLFRRLRERRVHLRVSKDRHVAIFDLFEDKLSNGTTYLRGKIGKGIFFDKVGTSLHIPSSTSEREDADRDRIRQIKVAPFIFIPLAHRFCLLRQKPVPLTVNDAAHYLKNALEQVKDKDDLVLVEVENDNMAIEQILAAEAVHRLDYNVSYTNDDFSGAMGKQLEERLKRSRIGKLRVSASADHHGKLEVKNEELLQGGIELARRNGSVSAKVTEDGAKKWVSTVRQPLVVNLKVTADRIWANIINFVRQQYRNSDEQSAN